MQKKRTPERASEARSATGRKRGHLTLWVWGGIAALTLAAFFIPWGAGKSPADPNDQAKIDLGRTIYARYCAACHGVNLEGQSNWRSRLTTGRMPAPPHDPSGHTWHHPDAVLFSITRDGLVPGRTAPPGYLSDMPAFGGTLSDAEIWAVLAFIKSTWPEDIRASQGQAGTGQRR